jgi:hypothetical protein
MSSRKRRRETKKIRDSYPTTTLKELEDEGVVPKNFHLEGSLNNPLTHQKLFDGYRFSQITWLIYIATAHHCYMI